MFSSIHKMLDRLDDKFEKLDPANDKFAHAKAFGIGVVNGFVDGAVFMYVPVLLACYKWKKKAKK